MTMTTWYQGTVIHGLHNGHTFGFPTANIRLAEHQFIESGVYAVRVKVANQVYNGMLYVGTRPTLHLTQTTIEINIFDFSQDIYNQSITFSIVQKVRNEVHFATTKDLIQQLYNDRKQIEQILL